MAAIKKENALPLASIVAVLASVLAIWSGVFDRGVSNGSLTEKVGYIEQRVNKINDWIDKKQANEPDEQRKLQDVKIDVVRIQEQLSTLKSKIEDMERRR
ncbi:hypothetical protein EVB81_126 [Rhizobium phage RHph_I46]|uniref:Uncharacterized protein n=1 Tax=Rhizobium phage RHph_I1_9 TaxID=2509729 RepID=A0A7S5R9F6_9CAUD|nr:hypothetical protein PP936_gp125 [Rhizobium phage RHph_I1_9]QIG69695.1 hypothetical protein EVB81_126 [Rhizobium phage RHph_I46]QIG70976.1 hypothetical protein EVB92_126 [Rhizobium phage RHph_I9]QIG73562.1 hypothetical protein EVC04_125 [Rhizobium phage RHph_I1_9]QIG76315.1 hypothetical protein EVC25_126 [Rhizobium phage RHph_I34]